MNDEHAVDVALAFLLVLLAVVLLSGCNAPPEVECLGRPVVVCEAPCVVACLVDGPLDAGVAAVVQDATCATNCRLLR